MNCQGILSVRKLLMVLRNVKERNKQCLSLSLVDTGRKLNVHTAFRRRPERLLNVLCTFNLSPVSMGSCFLRN